MNTNRTRDILVGTAVVIVIVLVTIFLVRRHQNAINIETSPLPTPVSQFQEELQNNFGITVPDNAVKADMKDVTGGNQMGIATYVPQNGKFDYTIIGNLEDATKGYFYKGWLVRGKVGDANYDIIALGTLNVGKGGWIVNFESGKDVTDHKTVWVTLESTNTSVPGKHILEGSFQ